MRVRPSPHARESPWASYTEPKISPVATASPLPAPTRPRKAVAKTLSVVDLFCGTGGISFGLTQADASFGTVGGIDLDPVASATARLNHPAAEILTAPIALVDPACFRALAPNGSINLIVGGPPCQGFSSLRPSRGEAIDDPRNSLYRDFQRFVSELRPKAFLMENVVGLVHASGGALLEDIVTGFAELGYETDWRILNAAHYGVPQKRERFFLLGARADVLAGGELAFPRPTHAFDGKTIGLRDKARHMTPEAQAEPAITVWDAVSDLPSIGAGVTSTAYRSEPMSAYQELMRSSGAPLTLHEATNHNAKMLEVIRHAGASKAALPPGLVSSGYSSCYSRLEADEPATTITVKFTSPASSKCIHPFDDRAITPREAARLQSFPDHFRFSGGRTAVARQLGNAVPPLFASAFAPVLRDLIRS